MKRAALASKLAALALIVAQVVFGETPDPRIILKSAGNAYASLKSFEIQAVSVIQTSTPDSEQTVKSRLVIASEQPGKFRVEAKGVAGITTISDGEQTWTYNSFLKQYTKTGATQSIEQAISVSSAAMLAPGPGEGIKSAKLLGEQGTLVGGSPHQCYVLEVEFDHRRPAGSLQVEERASKFWIDKNTYLVLKRTVEQHVENWPPTRDPADVTTTVSVESLKVNEPVAATLFNFTPPSGAALVDSFEYPGMKKSSLDGKQAVDFRLNDLSGKEFQLANFRGKTVLLDFWATWCAPCRAEMPVIEKLHQNNKELVVLGIDAGETRDIVQEFVTKNRITYPILLAGHDRVVNDYDAQSLPTVVIVDPNGTIRTHKTGYSPETETQLRSAILAAAAPQVSAGNPARAGTGGAAYRMGRGVSAPSVLYRIEPEFSEEARRAHFQGTVVLSVIVSAEGVPGDIKVLRPIGYGLDEKAVEAVRQWKFRPGMKDGRPVAVFSTIEVDFRLDGRPNPPQPTAASAPPMSDEPEGPPQNAEEAFRRATRFARAHRVDESIALLTQAISMKPDWAQAYFSRARARYQQNRYNEAIRDFDHALQLNPNRAAWYDSRGLAYSYSGRQGRAIEDYTRAIELNPDGASFYYSNRGWAYTETGQPEKAIRDLTKAIELGPDNVRAYENRALAYMRIENWKEAVADYTAAIQLYPGRWLYEKRAEAKRAAGNAAGAAEDLRKAAQMPQQQAPKP